MISKKEIVSQTQQLETLRNLVETYEEISALQMRHIRSSVLLSRNFIDNLEEIYQQLQQSYQWQLHDYIKRKKKNHTLLLSPKNGKSIAVLLSANSGLNGDIIRRTFETFSDFLSSHEAEAVIIGRQGQRLMEELHPEQKFVYYDLPDVNVTPHLLFNLISHLLQYEHIYLFYGKFQTFLSQTPFTLDVYGQSANSDTTIPPVYYLFEPSLEKILTFFEQQIFSSIIEQTFRESELAKHAARMVALDEATQNISDRLKKVNLQRRIVNHHLLNQKQEQAISSIHLWHLR